MLRLCRSPVRKASGFPGTLSVPSAARLSLAAMFFPLTGQASLTALDGGKPRNLKFAMLAFWALASYRFGSYRSRY